MSGSIIGGVDEQLLKPRDAEMKRNRSQAAHSSGENGKSKHALPFIGHAVA
jgi:hypothetical protein